MKNGWEPALPYLHVNRVIYTRKLILSCFKQNSNFKGRLNM